MKFEDIIINYLWEQVNHPGGLEPDDNERDERDGEGNLQMPDDDEPEQQEPGDRLYPRAARPEPNQIETPQPEQPDDTATHNETIKKKVNAIAKVKAIWVTQAAETNMAISEASMDDAIDFFNQKKGNLRPLSNPPNNRDIPQLFALKQRFPEFPASDLGRIRDIQTYTWPQIIFFIERYVEGPEEVVEEEGIEEGERIQIEGVNLSRFLPKAYEMWEAKRKKLYDANGVTIIKIESKEQSIAYGGLQNCLKDTHPHSISNYWCTTKIGSGNLYTSYRHWRAFYYVLNKNVPEDHQYRMFAIGAVKKDDNNYPFTLTNMYNSSNISSLTFEEVVSHTQCSELNNAKKNIVWFEETEEESIERIYDTYTFDGRNRDTDFTFLKPRAQLRYIETARPIKSGKALLSLGEVMIDGRAVDLQEEYVRRTTAANFQNRYNTSDPTEDVFAMISALRTPNIKFLNNILKNEQGIPDGIYGVVSAILNKSYKGSWKDYTNPQIRVLQSKLSLGKFGVYDLSKYKWVKPVNYSVQPVRFYLNKEDRTVYAFIKYVSDNDYFYWLFRREDLLKKDKTNPNYLKGKFLESRDGDELIGRLVKV